MAAVPVKCSLFKVSNLSKPLVVRDKSRSLLKFKARELQMSQSVGLFSRWPPLWVKCFYLHDKINLIFLESGKNTKF